jgi:hypothetical protein
MPALPEAMSGEQQSGVHTVAGAILEMKTWSQRDEYPAPVNLNAVTIGLDGFLRAG